MSVNCNIRSKCEDASYKLFPAVVMHLLTLAPAVGSQEYGYSYLRMEVAGKTIRNFVPNGLWAMRGDTGRLRCSRAGPKAS